MNTTTNGQPDRVKLKVKEAGDRGRRRQSATRDTGRADRLLRSFSAPAEETENG